MTWIEPLELQTWLVNVFAGTPIIFGAIIIFVIASMSAYFKMNHLNMFLMIGIFMLMFFDFLDNGIILVFSVISGLIIGMVVTKILR